MRNAETLSACLLLSLLIHLTASAYGQFRKMPSPPAEPPDWSRLRPTFYDKKLAEAQKAILSPSPEDQAAFAESLSQERMGLFRLLPKGKYEFSDTVSADRDPNTILPILGGGAYYSFAERTHKFGPWSEILLENNRVLAGPASKALGILTSLGDIPLESVTLDTPGLSFLAKLTPPKKYQDVADLRAKISRGLEAGGFTYGSAIEAAPNTTYALRSVLYQKDGYLVFPNDPYTRLGVSRIGYDGSDILIAFRIIRRNADDSITILWRRLKKFQALKIEGGPESRTIKHIKQLIEREIGKGTKTAQVIALLDLHEIAHSDYIEAYRDESAAPGTAGLVYATIPNIERRVRAIFDLHIQFYFDENKEFIGYEMKKIRR